MAGWGEFAAAMVLFLGSHALTARPALKASLVARLGQRGFTLAYSVLSLALLGWVIVAAGRAPFVALWMPVAWQGWAALGLMLVASVLASQALAGVNPLSFGSRAAPFDPERPGIAGLSRHPLLLALALWALAHLLANGDLAHLLLFGPMGAFALAGMAVIDVRKRRSMPDWSALARNAPLIGWPRDGLPLWPTLAGVALWGAMILLHPVVIGPDPLAGL